MASSWLLRQSHYRLKGVLLYTSSLRKMVCINVCLGERNLRPAKTRRCPEGAKLVYRVNMVKSDVQRIMQNVRSFTQPASTA